MAARKGKRGGEPDHLYEREGIFYARITVNGSEHRRSLKTRDRKEAERRLEGWLKELSPYHGTIRHTWKEAWQLWFEAGQWKPKTIKSYGQILGVLNRYFDDLFWDQIDKARLQAFVADRRQQGTGVATINRHLSVISGIADHVKDLDGWPEINPVQLLPSKPRREKRQPYIRPPDADIEAMFARMRGTFGDLCRVALRTGARRDEIVFLKRDDVRDGKATLYDTKNHIPRTIDLDPEARAIIERQPRGRTPYVFQTRNGDHYKRVTEMWREVVLRAQNRAQKEGGLLTRMRFHDLRHEYAIRYLENGGLLYALQKLLGHGSIRQTERYLIYLTPAQAAHAQGATAQDKAHPQRFSPNGLPENPEDQDTRAGGRVV